MYGKLFRTLLLSITMTSFIIPGIASLRLTNPQASTAIVAQKSASSSNPNMMHHVYAPFVHSQPTSVVSVPEPATTGTLEPTPRPTSQPTPQPVEPKATATPVVKLPMEGDYHSQRWETSTKNACGPTALLMVLDYFGEKQPLPDVIRSFKISPAKGGFDPNCETNPVCLSAAVLEQVAHTTYKMAVKAGDGWTLDQVYDALSQGQPVIADVTWRLVPGGTGHFVVIYGIDRQNQIVYYHDPYDGADLSASWDEFLAAWNGPVDAGDPLQPDGHRSWAMALVK